MHTLAFEGVEISRERGDERLAFPRDHFCNVAGMEHHATEQLHVVMPHAEEPTTALATDRKCLHENVIERLTGGETAAELRGLRT